MQAFGLAVSIVVKMLATMFRQKKEGQYSEYDIQFRRISGINIQDCTPIDKMIDDYRYQKYAGKKRSEHRIAVIGRCERKDEIQKKVLIRIVRMDLIINLRPTIR